MNRKKIARVAVELSWRRRKNTPSQSQGWDQAVMHILFVEDEAKIANFVQAGLKEQGFVVDYCDHGDEGYGRAMNNAYDVIVLDIMVPGKDGLSILKHLRRSRKDGYSKP
ncbi:response regulator [Leptolyngbya sp. 7M]|uniref:response regulator n=1 Tax=Leptolyngbya sp. 7M TaxID=2812896 RepID=UPI0021F18591|nr:response regulator [Leptolyngbya sp. 7M]